MVSNEDRRAPKRIRGYTIGEIEVTQKSRR